MRDKANSDIPVFATFMFTLFMLMLLFYGIDSLIYLLFGTPYFLNKYIMYAILVIIAIPNYLFFFRNEKFLACYRERMPSLYVILIVFILFAGSLFLILQAGPRNLKFH